MQDMIPILSIGLDQMQITFDSFQIEEFRDQWISPQDYKKKF